MLEKLFGSSPVPTILGLLLGAMTAAEQIIREQGLPEGPAGWIQLGVAVLLAALGMSAKQTNVSNAPKPEPVATVVPKPPVS
jgi:predicted acyltransferase